MQPVGAMASLTMGSKCEDIVLPSMGYLEDVDAAEAEAIEKMTVTVSSHNLYAFGLQVKNSRKSNTTRICEKSRTLSFHVSHDEQRSSTKESLRCTMGGA